MSKRSVFNQRAVVDKLSAEIRKALDQPDVQTRLNNLSLDTLYMTPEQFAARLKSDYAKYGKLVELTGAKVD